MPSRFSSSSSSLLFHEEQDTTNNRQPEHTVVTKDEHYCWVRNRVHKFNFSVTRAITRRSPDPRIIMNISIRSSSRATTPFSKSIIGGGKPPRYPSLHHFPTKKNDDSLFLGKNNLAIHHFDDVGGTASSMITKNKKISSSFHVPSTGKKEGVDKTFPTTSKKSPELEPFKKNLTLKEQAGGCVVSPETTAREQEPVAHQAPKQDDTSFGIDIGNWQEDDYLVVAPRTESVPEEEQVPPATNVMSDNTSTLLLTPPPTTTTSTGTATTSSAKSIKAEKQNGRSRHRRMHNTDFAPILDYMRHLEALPVAFPNLDVSTLISEVDRAILTFDHHQRNNRLCRRTVGGRRGRRFEGKCDDDTHHNATIMRPPLVLSIEVRLDPIRIQQFHSLVRHAHEILLAPPSSTSASTMCLSDTFKANLGDFLETCMKQLRDDLDRIQTNQLLVLKHATATTETTATATINMLSQEQVMELFSPCYEQAIAGFQSAIGLVQIFQQQGKEFMGPLQHGVGVIWAYDKLHHNRGAHQLFQHYDTTTSTTSGTPISTKQEQAQKNNVRLNLVMMRWMYKHWGNGCILREAETIRIAKKYNLNPIAVYEWWENASAVTVKPFEGSGVVPSQDLYAGRRRQRQVRSR